jgi:hypothetical protein
MIRVRFVLLLLTTMVVIPGCSISASSHTQVNHSPAAAPTTSAIRAGFCRIHVHEVENSATGREYQWTIEGTGPDTGSNTSTTTTQSERPISVAVAPAGSQHFRCQISVRAETAPGDKTHVSESTAIALGSDTRSESNNWTESGPVASVFKVLQPKDSEQELPKQVVLATVNSKPVSIRVGE